MIDQGRKPSQVFPYQNQPHQSTYPYQYVETSHTLYHPPPTPYHVYNTQTNYYQPRTPSYQNPHPYHPIQAPTYENRPHIAPRAHPNLETRNTRNYTKLAQPLAQLFERMKAAVEEKASIEVTSTSTKTPTIWDAEPEETLKNWTYTLSMVHRESW
ncbi:hypothetical protein HAX54_005112 [Datura stramonium]|uniref:Uncharacterized protein n=1 Tax=Datura stramonium TaxID=4076 RepID=A0ABS8T859_DATST|nr:hypothetical protein [Datura stramonium]